MIQLMTLKDASSLKTFSLRMPLLPRFQLQWLDPVPQLVELSLPLPRPMWLQALSWNQLAQHHQPLLSTRLQQLKWLQQQRPLHLLHQPPPLAQTSKPSPVLSAVLPHQLNHRPMIVHLALTEIHSSMPVPHSREVVLSNTTRAPMQSTEVL